MAIAYPNDGSLVGWWCPSLDDAGNGTTTLTDLVGNNDGTLTNMDPATDWVADVSAGGIRRLDFDGANDHVVTTLQDVIGQSEFSVSAWFKTTATTTADNCLFSFGTSTTAAGFLLNIENGVAWTRCFGNVASGSSGLNDGNWHHIVVNKSANSSISGISIYIDGVALTLTTSGSDTLDFGDANPTTIGRAMHGGYNWDGSLDHIQFFVRQLTAGEITTLYDSGNGRGYQAAATSRHNVFQGMINRTDGGMIR